MTFSCYQRRPFPSSLGAKTVFVKILSEVRECYSFAGRICADAGAYAFVDWRTREGQPVEGDRRAGRREVLERRTHPLKITKGAAPLLDA